MLCPENEATTCLNFQKRVQVQVVALECLPRIPARKLRRALAGEELGRRILACLANSSKEVRWAVPVARHCCRRRPAPRAAVWMKRAVNNSGCHCLLLIFTAKQAARYLSTYYEHTQ